VQVYLFPVLMYASLRGQEKRAEFQRHQRNAVENTTAAAPHEDGTDPVSAGTVGAGLGTGRAVPSCPGADMVAPKEGGTPAHHVTVSIGGREHVSTRYLWRTALRFCFHNPTPEGIVCGMVLVWGTVSGLLGVLVTAGAIPKTE